MQLPKLLHNAKSVRLARRAVADAAAGADIKEDAAAADAVVGVAEAAEAEALKPRKKLAIILPLNGATSLKNSAPTSWLLALPTNSNALLRLSLSNPTNRMIMLKTTMNKMLGTALQLRKNVPVALEMHGLALNQSVWS